MYDPNRATQAAIEPGRNPARSPLKIKSMKPNSERLSRSICLLVLAPQTRDPVWSIPIQIRRYKCTRNPPHNPSPLRPIHWYSRPLVQPYPTVPFDRDGTLRNWLVLHPASSGPLAPSIQILRTVSCTHSLAISHCALGNRPSGNK